MIVPADEPDDPDSDLETCVICGKTAVTYYPPDSEDGAPSCGRPACEYQMQAAQDHHDECGDR